ncbi:TolC family protein [Ravibacter arvi]|uniref:TolC family protein n=1 Tax=Ravibacter arvi TaxID=2051041 RepID=A0ABP8M015_9BACT
MKIRLVHLFSIFLLTGSLPIRAQQRLTLQQALQNAKSNNSFLKAAYTQIGVAESDVVTAGLRPNPSLNNQSLQLLRPSSLPANPDWYNGRNRQIWWQLTKPFQLAGQREARLELANKNVSAAQKTFEETERNLFADVAAKWLELWRAQKQLNLIDLAIANVDSLAEINRLRFKNQVITQTELFRTELLAKQYALERKTAGLEVANKQKELGYLLGIPGSISIDTADQFALTNPAGIDSLLAQSLQNRSDIAGTRALLDASVSNIRLQKALSYPQPELGVIWNPQNKVPYLGIYATIDLPVFNRNQGEIKKSYVLKEQAAKQVSDLEQRIRTEISTAWDSYQLQKKNAESFRGVLSQSQTILDNVRYSYLKGGTTIIDFLEAQRSWLETQQQYHEALGMYRQSYIKLLFATGIINQLAQ